MADNVQFFCGNDEYLVGLNARKMVDKFCPAAEQSLSLEIIDGSASKIDDATFAIDSCIAAFRTVGLFGGKKVVWLRDASFLKNAVIMKNAEPNCAAPNGFSHGRTPSMISLVHSKACMPTKVAPSAAVATISQNVFFRSLR